MRADLRRIQIIWKSEVPPHCPPPPQQQSETLTLKCLKQRLLLQLAFPLAVGVE